VSHEIRVDAHRAAYLLLLVGAVMFALGGGAGAAFFHDRAPPLPGASTSSPHPEHPELSMPGYWAETWTLSRTGIWAPESPDCALPPPQELPASTSGCSAQADSWGPYWQCGSWHITMNDVHPHVGWGRFHAETKYPGSRGDECRLAYVGVAQAPDAQIGSGQ
jgi:hypothetical protein